MSKAVMVQSKRGVEELFQKMAPEMSKVLPKHLSPDRMLKMAIIATSKQPKLLQCTQQSFALAMMTSAELGLDCSGTLGEAYMVPYGDTATLIPGYRGFIKLARQSGAVKDWQAHVVYENDKFDIEYGTSTQIRHVPLMSGNRGNPYCAYSIAILKDGTVSAEAMTADEIEAIRKRSKAGGSGPWMTDKLEMWRKTVVRRHAKYLPLSPELERMIEIDNENAPIDVPYDQREPEEERYPIAIMEQKIADAGFTANDFPGFRSMTREQFDARMKEMEDIRDEITAAEFAESAE